MSHIFFFFLNVLCPVSQSSGVKRHQSAGRWFRGLLGLRDRRTEIAPCMRSQLIVNNSSEPVAGSVGGGSPADC